MIYFREVKIHGWKLTKEMQEGEQVASQSISHPLSGKVAWGPGDLPLGRILSKQHL